MRQRTLHHLLYFVLFLWLLSLTSYFVAVCGERRAETFGLSTFLRLPVQKDVGPS